jgi:uncharacterized membrane protein
VNKYFLHIVGFALLILGLIILIKKKHRSKSELEFFWLKLKTTETGLILALVGVVCMVLGVKFNSSAASQTEQNDTIATLRIDTSGIIKRLIEKKVEDPQKIIRTFYIRSQYSKILLRFLYLNIDTVYAIPMDFTLKEIKFALLNHFYPDRLDYDRFGVEYFVRLNGKAYNENKTLERLKAKDNDRITILRQELMQGGSPLKVPLEISHDQTSYLFNVLASNPYDSSAATKFSILYLEMISGIHATPQQDKVGQMLFTKRNLDSWHSYVHKKDMRFAFFML